MPRLYRDIADAFGDGKLFCISCGSPLMHNESRFCKRCFTRLKEDGALGEKDAGDNGKLSPDSGK